MVPRFYVPDAHAEGQQVGLSSDEAEHFTRVLRGQAGDRIRVFDGRGQQFVATVREARRRTVVVEIGAPSAAAAEPGIRVSLAQAVLKGDKMDDVVRDAVMMGVSHVQPLVSTRTEVSMTALERADRVARWHRIAVASVKQCGRAVVPTIAAPATFDAYARAIATGSLMFVEPGEHDGASALADLPSSCPAAVTVLVGPEGGWTPAEIEQARAACRLVTLKGATLRADAMPVVALAALLAHWGEL